tara:strand:+ start:5947 stop:7836 length:1890 start_codon:yes stop_codon:yes gene_type:complete
MNNGNNNQHSMITRSKQRKHDEERKDKKERKDKNEEEIHFEQFDKKGNLLDLIDDSDIENDFDNDMFQKELSRLRGSPQKKAQPVKRITKKKGNNIIDLIIPYLLMNMLTKNPKKKLKKKKAPTNPFNHFIDEGSIGMNINDIDTSLEDSSDDESFTSDTFQEPSDEDDIESSIDIEILSSIGSPSEEEEEETEEEEEEEYDEYDNEFIELIENDLDDNEELEYFSNLEVNEKEKHLEDLNEIKTINKSNIPLRFKILNSNMDIRTKSIAIENINKLSEMDVSTGEYCKMDKWINGLIKIPFGIYNRLEINNENTKEEKQELLHNIYQSLDKSIYGHKDAKMHILQVIGKWIKNPSSQGNVLALQGPMGNGKTTLVKEGIAKAINRPFAFIALGGASDSSFFDGHSYTYEGSHWGRIIDILIESKCMNPIIYFDELDKVSETHKGEEIVHLLTHLTDPSQNNLFQDNYFPGIHIDLSKTLFIFSFNDETKIDRILKDRMYVINTKGFKPNDKIMICNYYILPELMDTFLFDQKDIVFTDESLLYIIEKHTSKEEGVRNLKRCLETIISKVNIYHLSNNNSNKSMDDNNIIPFTFTIPDFKLPLHITKDIIDILISSKGDIGAPPEHMYM